MDVVLQFANVFLPLLYLAATAGYGLIFFAGNDDARRWAPNLFYATLALHLGYLVLLFVRWQQFPIATVSQILSAVALAVAVVYAIVEWRGKERSTGFFMLLLTFFLELLSALLRSPQPELRKIFHSPLFAAHTSMAILGYAAFVVAAVYGFLFLRLYREIKRHRYSHFFDKLPPLQVMERLMQVAMTCGLVALAGTVICGAVLAEQEFPGRWMYDPKVLATAVTWVFYGIALLLHRSSRWQGRHLALASLVGFFTVLFSLLAVNLFFTEVHGFI